MALGLRVYRSDKFKEIRVRFFEGLSEKEEYEYAGKPPIPSELVDLIRAENPGLHHVKMELRTVRVESGFYPKSDAELYCVEHYPFYRDFAISDRFIDTPKSARIYVCPRCVAECRDYAKNHPELAKPK
jgi:hypothetical protein